MTETNNEKDIAVLNARYENIEKLLLEVKSQISVLSDHYASKEGMEGIRVSMRETHADYEKRLRTIEAQMSIFFTQVKTWGAVAVIALGVVQFLIGKFL